MKKLKTWDSVSLDKFYKNVFPLLMKWLTEKIKNPDEIYEKCKCGEEGKWRLAHGVYYDEHNYITLELIIKGKKGDKNNEKRNSIK